MGAYINPKEGKRQWLQTHGQPFDAYGTLWEDLPSGELPVCLVNNFAAGIAVSEDEYLLFLNPDGRPKEWFLVDEDELHNICPSLESFIERSRAVTKRG